MSNIFSDNHQIRKVSTFSELVNTPFQGNMNAVCWYRDLVGDFNEIVSKLQLEENITEVSAEDLSALDLSEKGSAARDIILNDLKLLSDFGALPSLNLLKNYERDKEFDFISTDVYSYHVDRSPLVQILFLCTYHGAASDILPNAQAEQKSRFRKLGKGLKNYTMVRMMSLRIFKKNIFSISIISPNLMPGLSIWE